MVKSGPGVAWTLNPNNRLSSQISPDGPSQVTSDPEKTIELNPELKYTSPTHTDPVAEFVCSTTESQAESLASANAEIARSTIMEPYDFGISPLWIEKVIILTSEKDKFITAIRGNKMQHPFANIIFTWAAKIGGDMKCVPVSKPTGQTESTRTTRYDLDQEDMFGIASDRALKAETEEYFQSQTEDDTVSNSSLDQRWY